jgi:ADP-heptose:LPS heptosyltransferase
MSPPPASRSSSRRRFLVVRAGALGDILLLRPAIDRLLRAGGDVTLLAPRGAGSVLLGSGIEVLLPWESPELAPLLLGERLQPWLEEQLQSFDGALAVTRDQALVEALRKRIPEVARVDPEPPPAVHAGVWFAKAAGTLGAPPEAPAGLEPLRLSYVEDQAAAALAVPLPEAFLAIHPGSGSPRKNWPAERFAALADALSPGRRFALVAGPADDQSSAALLALAPRARVLRELPLRLLGGVLARAAVYVGNDSGVSHLAAAFGAPTLALFGPTDPAAWAPLGSLVRTLRGEAGELAAISVAAASAVAKALKSEGRAPPSG